MLLVLTSCGNSKADTEEAKQKSPEVGEMHNESEAKEAMLTEAQYRNLNMRIDTVAQRVMKQYVEANGQLEVPPQNEATITTVVGANVVSIEVIEGDKVKKGQTVAYLSHPNIIQKQTDYLNAYSNSQFLKKEFERQKKMYDGGVGSGANFQKAEAEYRASQSLAKGLEAQLEQLNIGASGVRNGTIYQRVALRSPIEGFVQKVSVKTGQYVEPQTDLFEIVDTHHVHADLMVFEKDVYKVKVGQQVSFNVQSIPGKELTAKIYSVGKTFEQNPKAIHVHAEIENKEGQLIPGMYVEGRIEIQKFETVAMPESAISLNEGKKYIFTAEREGNVWSFKPVEITTGPNDGNWVAIDFVDSIGPNTTFAYNNAYYLMAQMKKGDAGHDH
jgi:cobalt-zinc-cadmium efflux system membrane fusion protein